MCAYAACLLLVSTLGQLVVEPEEIDESLVGRRIVVDGVYLGTFGEGPSAELRLHHCKAKFISTAVRLDSVRRGNLEIVGDVRAGGGNIVVDVRSLKELPSDVERYQRQTFKLSNDDYSGWYKLAEWSRDRSQRYKNSELAKLALTAYQTAVTAERTTMSDNPAGLRQLAKRIRHDGILNDFDFDDLEHQILHVELQAKPMAQWTADELSHFAQKVRERLEVTESVARGAAEAHLRQQYDNEPLETYRSASSFVRKQLARYWEVQLLHQIQRLEYATGRRDAFTLAEEAAAQMPEYPAIAQEWTKVGNQALTDEKVQPLSRKELEELAKRLAAQSPPEAERLRARWLKLQEDLLRLRERDAVQRDAQTRYELANLYLEWLDSADAQQEAVRLFVEALEIDPAFADAEAKLRQLGHQRSSTGKWIRSDEAANTPDPRARRTLRTGMPAEEVLRILGRPDTKSRMITASRTGRFQSMFQWAYRSGAETTLVFFEESSSGQLRVARIRETK